MLKINLSDQDAEQTAVQQEAGEQPDTGTKKKAGKSPSGEKTSKKTLTPLTLALLVIAVLVFGYLQRATIMNMFGIGQEPPVTVQEPAPPPPPPEPEPEPVPEEPDPVFVAVNTISDAMPPRVWLSSFLMMYDGSYEIRGISFEYAPMGAFAAKLEGIGEVGSRELPARTNDPDAVYTFSMAGTLAHVAVPGILDDIPAGRLAELGGTAAGMADELGVEFTTLPDAARTYSDRELPFELVGPYDGLKTIIAELCPEEGSTRVYRMVITPATPGRTFNTVRAAFSLKTMASI